MDLSYQSDEPEEPVLTGDVAGAKCLSDSSPLILYVFTIDLSFRKEGILETNRLPDLSMTYIRANPPELPSLSIARPIALHTKSNASSSDSSSRLLPPLSYLGLNESKCPKM